MAKMGCAQCGGATKKMAKGGNTSFGMLSVKAGVDKNPKPTAADRIAGAKTPNPRLERLATKVNKKTTAGKPVSKSLTKRYDKAVDKVIVAGMKKMAKGGMMKGTVGGPPKKPFAAGIPYFIGAGQTGPESMQNGGALSSALTAVKRLQRLKKTTGIANKVLKAKVDSKKNTTNIVGGPMTKVIKNIKAVAKKK